MTKENTPHLGHAASYQNYGGPILAKMPDIPRFGVWQPIETAPRDGTDILVFDGELIYLASYGWEENEKPVWFNGSPGIRDCTHWMPLPDPPISPPSR